MTRTILICLVTLLPLISSAQFSLSAAYRHSVDGVDFLQNHLKLNANWQQPRHFHFSTGFEFTFKQLDYESKERKSSYSNGGPGYFTSNSDIYERTAKVNYINLKGGLFFDWAVIDSPSFKLLLGGFGQFGTTIYENEKEHETLGYHSYSKETPDEYTSGSTTDPITFTEFNAVEMAIFNANIGVKLSPRKYFNQTYIQLDMSMGRTVQRIFKDLRGTDCYFNNSDECFEYNYLFDRKKPMFLSIGFTLGYTF